MLPFMRKMLIESDDTYGDFFSKVTSLKHEMAKAAQKVYDEWDQDEEGIDPEYGAGGICQDIADAIAGVLIDHDINAITVDSEGMVDQHVWAVAYDPESRLAFNVDIPPSVYEIGSGYVWKKRPNVSIDEGNISIDDVDYDLAGIDDLIEARVRPQSYSRAMSQFRGSL